MQRRIRQLKSVYEQARDVDVLLDLLQAENRAYVRGMSAQCKARAVNQDLLRDGNRVYVLVPPAFGRRRASYLKSLCEGVLGHPVEVSIQRPMWGAPGVWRIALNLPVSAKPTRCKSA